MSWPRSFPATVLAKSSELIPAAGLALFVTAILCGLQLMPVGKALLLVRSQGDDATSAVMAAASADAAFVDIPARPALSSSMATPRR